MTKTCTKCLEDLDVSLFRSAGKRRPGQLRSHCKKCLSKSWMIYASVSADKIRIKAKRYKGRAKQINRKNYLANRDLRKANQRKYYAENAEKIRASERLRYASKSPDDKRRDNERQRRQRHNWKKWTPTPEQLQRKYEVNKASYAAGGRIKQYADKWRAKNKSKFLEYIKEYRANPENRDKLRAWAQSHRVRRMEASGHCSGEEWRQIKERYNHTCLCCLKKEPDVNLTMDHVIPLTRGGQHSPDNIQPLCLSCNSKKRRRIIDYRLGAELMPYWLIGCKSDNEGVSFGKSGR